MFDWSPCWGWRKSEFMGSRRRRKSRIDDLRNPKLALRIFFFWFSDSLWASIILQQLGHCCKIMNVSRPKYGRDVHNFVQFCISGTTHCANCSNDRQSVQSRIAISNRISIELDYVEFVLSSTQLQNAKENRKSGWHKKKCILWKLEHCYSFWLIVPAPRGDTEIASMLVIIKLLKIHKSSQMKHRKIKFPFPLPPHK